MDFLIGFYPVFMRVILIIIALLIVLNFKILIKPFKKITKNTWILLFFIFLFALLLRIFVIPHTHHIYFDEFEHINIAQNILYSGSACGCLDGSNIDCNSCSLTPWPPGYHTVLSMTLGVFGDSENTAFMTNAVIGSLSILLIFLLLYLLLKDTNSALIGSLMLAVLPVHLKFSGTTSTGIFSIFFFLLTFLFLEYYFSSRQLKSLLLFLTSLLYLSYIRPENLLFIPCFFIYILLCKPKRIRLLNFKHILLTLVLLILIIPSILTLYYTKEIVHSPGWNDPLPERLGYLSNQLGHNLLFFFYYIYTPITLTILFIIGAKNLFQTNKKLLSSLFIFFFFFLILYSSYSIGSLIGKPADTVRYSLVLYIPLILIAGAGCRYLLKIIKLKKWMLSIAIAIFLLISVIPTFNFIFTASQFTAEHWLLVKIRGQLPEEAVVIAYNPAIIISTTHRRAMTPHKFDLLHEKGYAPESLYLYMDIPWHAQPETSAKIEKHLKSHYEFKLLATAKKYRFYRLSSID